MDRIQKKDKICKNGINNAEGALAGLVNINAVQKGVTVVSQLNKANECSHGSKLSQCGEKSADDSKVLRSNPIPPCLGWTF